MGALVLQADRGTIHSFAVRRLTVAGGPIERVLTVDHPRLVANDTLFDSLTDVGTDLRDLLRFGSLGL